MFEPPADGDDMSEDDEATLEEEEAAAAAEGGGGADEMDALLAEAVRPQSPQRSAALLK
jgi:hypothetical protein